MSPLCRECKDRAKTTTSDVSSMNDFCDRCGGPRSIESERPDPPRYMDPENEVEDGAHRKGEGLSNAELAFVLRYGSEGRHMNAGLSKQVWALVEAAERLEDKS